METQGNEGQGATKTRPRHGDLRPSDRTSDRESRRGRSPLTSLRMESAKVEEMGLWRKEQSGVPRRQGLSSSSSSREVWGQGALY